MLSRSVEFDVKSTVLRYIDEYNWGWGITAKLINRRFGLELTNKELMKLYRSAKADYDDDDWRFCRY